MKKQSPRSPVGVSDPTEDTIEPTVEIVQLALVDAKPDHSGYDPYNTRSLTPLSRVRPKVDVWQSKRKRS